MYQFQFQLGPTTKRIQSLGIIAQKTKPSISIEWGFNRANWRVSQWKWSEKVKVLKEIGYCNLYQKLDDENRYAPQESFGSFAIFFHLPEDLTWKQHLPWVSLWQEHFFHASG